MDFTYLKDFMDRLTSWRIPGNCVSVYVGGKEVFKYCSGYSDVQNKIPFSDEMLVNIYSCSKVTTVTAALQLYEKGFFLLDTPVYEFIPEFKNIKVKDGNGWRDPASPVTMRSLFTMTSGLTYDLGTDGVKKARELTNGKMDTVTVAKCLAEDGLVFDPGDAWNYSLSHDVLAAVVAVISGKPFRQYVKENIFDPLGMTSATYHNKDVQDKMAEQYAFTNGDAADLVDLQSNRIKSVGGYLEHVSKDVQTFELGPEYDSGGAGITVSVPDYAKLSAALANFGLGVNGERILASGTVDLLRTNQLTTPKQFAGFGWPQLLGYGYGLGVRTCIDIARSGSNGSLGEFGWGGAAGATVLVDPDENIGIFYAHHMLNPQEDYYQPRLRNVLYASVLR